MSARGRRGKQENEKYTRKWIRLPGKERYFTFLAFNCAGAFKTQDTFYTLFRVHEKKTICCKFKILPSVQDFHQVSYVFKVGKKSFETLYIRNVLHQLKVKDLNCKMHVEVFTKEPSLSSVISSQQKEKNLKPICFCNLLSIPGKPGAALQTRCHSLIH